MSDRQDRAGGGRLEAFGEDAVRLVDRVAVLPSGRRSLVAVAGAPGSGKSTFAEALADALNAGAAGRASVLPMDGYHFDDRVLADLGRLDRKGAPDTFDVGGLRHMLLRLKTNAEAAVAVPVFDRALELSRGSARLVSRTTDIVIVEGNYLLSSEDPWADLAPSFDLKVFIDVPETVLRARLLRRWSDFGHGPESAAKKTEENDLPNGRYVRDKSVGADVTIRVGA